MQGVALAPGAAGDRLRVKNLSSGKRVDGLVLSSGEVLVR
jgi:flagella basal body P-ring formation protein FlgA